MKEAEAKVDEVRYSDMNWDSARWGLLSVVCCCLLSVPLLSVAACNVMFVVCRLSLVCCLLVLCCVLLSAVCRLSCFYCLLLSIVYCGLLSSAVCCLLLSVIWGLPVHIRDSNSQKQIRASFQHLKSHRYDIWSPSCGASCQELAFSIHPDFWSQQKKRCKKSRLWEPTVRFLYL